MVLRNTMHLRHYGLQQSHMHDQSYSDLHIWIHHHHLHRYHGSLPNIPVYARLVRKQPMNHTHLALFRFLRHLKYHCHSCCPLLTYKKYIPSSCWCCPAYADRHCADQLHQQGFLHSYTCSCQWLYSRNCILPKEVRYVLLHPSGYHQHRPSSAVEYNSLPSAEQSHFQNWYLAFQYHHV